MKNAFRCKNCGRLHTSDDAAESAHPHACCVCDAGVRFDTRGKKTPDPSNWEVLADATPKRLSELGLTTEDVERHQSWAKGSSSRKLVAIDVSAEDGPGTKDGAG